MSDNPNPFDIEIARIDRAAKAAQSSALLTANPRDVAQLRQHAAEQARLVAEKAKAEKIERFQRAVAEAVAHRGRDKRWSRQDFTAAKTIVDYLVSVGPVTLTAYPRQSVADTAKSLFRVMLEKGTGLPKGTFQGERDIAAKRSQRLAPVVDINTRKAVNQKRHHRRSSAS